ncbi:MAG TPA: hypothetical protein VIT18_04095, partial [Terrimicrobiaceae bacterium]
MPVYGESQKADGIVVKFSFAPRFFQTMAREMGLVEVASKRRGHHSFAIELEQPDVKETVEKPTYVTLPSIFERSQGAKRRRMGCGVPISPQSRSATDKLSDTARAENWRNPGGKKGSHPFLGVSFFGHLG